MPSRVAWLDYSEDQRRRMREVIDLFRETPAPALLIGDLNTRLGHADLRPLDRMPDVVEALRRTDPDRARNPIDHIYVKGLRVLPAGLGPVAASDHPSLWAELELVATQR